MIPVGCYCEVWADPVISELSCFISLVVQNRPQRLRSHWFKMKNKSGMTMGSCWKHRSIINWAHAAGDSSSANCFVCPDGEISPWWNSKSAELTSNFDTDSRTIPEYFAGFPTDYQAGWMMESAQKHSGHWWKLTSLKPPFDYWTGFHLHRKCCERHKCWEWIYGSSHAAHASSSC